MHLNKIKTVIGATVIGLSMTVSSASALTIDTEEILRIVDEAVLGVQQKTMLDLYPTMPLKDQMRGKMMQERAANNYLQDIIQPQMMAKNTEQLKLQTMESMVKQ